MKHIAILMILFCTVSAVSAQLELLQGSGFENLARSLPDGGSSPWGASGEWDAFDVVRETAETHSELQSVRVGYTTTVKHTQKEGSFSFGVIADIQYADKEKRGARHYRKAIAKLEECVDELNRQELSFTIQLGDLIDGNETQERTLSDLLDVFNKLSMPKYHVIGNHCLVVGKKNLHEELNLSTFYYDFTMPSSKGWRFVVLDGNDAGYGVLGKGQLEWLESTLAQACANSEKVIVFNHFALLKSAARHHRMKTPQPVLKLINESGCVVAYFAGHDHEGGYAFHEGIHHITVKGMVEAPIHNAYAVIEVYPAKLKEVGYGKEPSRTLKFKLGDKPY